MCLLFVQAIASWDASGVSDLFQAYLNHISLENQQLVLPSLKTLNM